VLEHTLDIALKDTLDTGKRCVEIYALYGALGADVEIYVLG
jgi:hypothetical protein